MIQVFNIDTQYAFRTIWLLEELSIPYSIKGNHESENTDNLNPLVQAVIIHDNALKITTAGAIRDYLLNTYDRKSLTPPIAHEEYTQYLQWKNYLDGYLFPLIQQEKIIEKLAYQRVPFFARSILKKTILGAIEKQLTPEITRQLKYIDEELGSKAWCCGSHFNAVDIDLTLALEKIQQIGGLSDEFQNIAGYLQSISQRSAYQLAKEKLQSPTPQLESNLTNEPEDETILQENDDISNSEDTETKVDEDNILKTDSSDLEEKLEVKSQEEIISNDKNTNQ